MHENLIACVVTQEAREAVARAAEGKSDLHLCTPAHAMTWLVAARDVAMIVWEVSAGTEDALQSIVIAAAARRQAVRVFVILDMTNVAARQVLMLLKHSCRLHLSLRQYDDLSTDIIAFHADSCEKTASSLILRRLVPLVGARAQLIVVNAALLAHRRMPVSEFARRCGSSARALQWSLRGDQVIPAKNLLGWMVSLHSLWRLDALAWNSKRTWSASGFSSHDAWAHYILRHAGASPAKLLRDGGFTALLARCEQELQIGGKANEGSPGQL